MKKYLMSGLAAIAICAAFTSCSKNNDVFDQGAINQQKTEAAIQKKNADYSTQFAGRYGNIDSNNDWGFGNIGKANTRSAVAGRANVYTDYHSFTTAPDAPDASDFKSVPTGVAYLGDFKDPWGGYQLYHFNIPDNTAWLDAAAVENCGMKFDRYSYTIYVKGEVAATNDIYFKAGSKLYLTEGAKLTLPGNYSFGQANVEIYVAEGAELICNGKLQFSGSKLINNGTVNVDELDIVSQYNAPASVYNCSKGVIKVTKDITMSKEGTFIANDHNIEAKNIGVTSGSIVYNNEGAKLTLSGTLGIENNNCEVINKGTLNAETLNTHGSAHFVNEDTGIVVIDDDTNVDSNNDTWVNNGKYTTKNFTFQATSSEVINNCKLTVINKFYIGLSQNASGDFKLDGSIITKDFELHGPANIRMTSNSVIKVSNTATMAITIPNYGIYGPASGDYAVFEAKNIVWESKNNFCVNYFGNLYVVADSHFEHSYLDGTSAAAQANGGIGEKPTYYFDPATVKMYVNGTDKPDYTIAESECNPGFEGNKKKIEYAVRIICEDLGASDDFDFNDVVFDALIEGGKTYIKVLAAGGTLPLTVAGVEVHGIFNVPVTTMVNTQKDQHYATKTEAQEFVIDHAYSSYKDIPVKVGVDKDANPMTEEGMITLQAEKGAAPQKIAVSTTFEWCDERQQIETKYTNFKTYVNASGTLWQ